MHLLALAMGLFMTVLGIAGVVFWIWTMIDCITNRRLTDTQKVVWTLVIFFIGFIGSLIYFFAGRGSRAPVPAQAYYYQPQPAPQAWPEAAPVESYPEYQEGYRAQESAPAYQPGAQARSSEVSSVSSQVQQEHIQISYPD